MLVYLDGTPPRDVTTIDFSDLTTIAIVGYPVGDGGALPVGQHIEFASDLDPQTYRRVKMRAEADATTQTFQDRLFQAITANNQWLNRTTTPTNQQTWTQIDHLTKECNALIKLALTMNDTTTGT